MSKTVRFKLYGDEIEAFHEFCAVVGMPPSEVAKRSLAYAMADSRRKAEQLQQADQERANAESRDTSSDTTETSVAGPGDTSDVLAQTQADDANSEASGTAPGL